MTRPRRDIIDDIKRRLGLRYDRELADRIGVDRRALSDWIHAETTRETTTIRLLVLLLSI